MRIDDWHTTPKQQERNSILEMVIGILIDIPVAIERWLRYGDVMERTISNITRKINPKVFLVAIVSILYLLLCIWAYRKCPRTAVAASSAVLGLALIAILLLYSHSKALVQRYPLIIYGSILSILCIIFMIIVPPLSVPDEGNHYLASYWFSGLLTGDANPTLGTLEMRYEDWRLVNETSRTIIGSSNYINVLNNFSFFSDDTSTKALLETGFSFGAQNGFAKIPTIAAIFLGKLFGLGAYPLFYLGRFFSIAFYVFCMVSAVRITPTGKPVFAAISMFPMSLQLAASYSYDAAIIGISFLFLALSLSAIFSNERLKGTRLAAIFILAILLAPCKAIYSLEVIILVLIPAKCFSSKRASVIFKVSILCACLAAILGNRLSELTHIASGNSAQPGQSASYTLGELLTKPANTLDLIVTTLLNQGDYYWESTIGFCLGWGQTELIAPAFLMMGYVLVTLASSRSDSGNEIILNGLQRLLLITIFVGVVAGSMLVMALAWTPSGSEIIQGVQGRYFLPALPLLFLSTQSKAPVNNGAPWATSLIGISILDIFYVLLFITKAFMLP